MNLVKDFESREIKRLSALKDIPNFRPGDTLTVVIKMIEDKERVQRFSGVCIAKGGTGLAKYFLLRKVIGKFALERKFALFSPLVESISVDKRGRVRRGKLYYLRNLTGKAARIPELIRKKKH